MDNLYITASGLNIGYEREIVVADINFGLKRGEAIALIGTNGSGKSTLLKTIVGLIPPISGNLAVFGGSSAQNTTRIAYLGQFHASGFVLPLRVIDVVRMGCFPRRGLLGKLTDEDEELVHHAMADMGIENLAELPLRSLSGGQQQRTYLAQVLAHHADLLVLDEPTSGLDVGGREVYLQAVKDELCRGAAVVVATHDIQEEAQLCNQVMLLARRVVAQGAPDRVITSEALLETFGIVIGADRKLTVLECGHGHDGGEGHPARQNTVIKRR